MKQLVMEFWNRLHPALQGAIIALLFLHILPLLVVWMWFWWQLFL